MNFELVDNMFQLILLSVVSIISLILAIYKSSQQLLILAFAYACFGMGTFFWLMHIAIMGFAINVFYVAEILWETSYLFYLTLQIFRMGETKVKFSLPALIVAYFASSTVLCYRILGPSMFFAGVFSVIIAVIAYLTTYRIVKKMPKRNVDVAFLIIIVLQLSLYIISRFMNDYTHFNLYFAVDITLTLCLVSLLPLNYMEVTK